MPTTRRRISRGRRGVGELSEIAYLYYTFGDFFEAEDYANGKTEEELKVFWNRHQKAIMQRYLKENRQRGDKGVRPWAFWAYDMPSPQKEISPGDGSLKVWNHNLKIYGFFETDFDYLNRLNLLETWERTELKNPT